MELCHHSDNYTVIFNISILLSAKEVTKAKFTNVFGRVSVEKLHLCEPGLSSIFGLKRNDIG